MLRHRILPVNSHVECVAKCSVRGVRNRFTSEFTPASDRTRAGSVGKPSQTAGLYGNMREYIQERSRTRAQYVRAPSTNASCSGNMSARTTPRPTDALTVVPRIVA